MKLDRRSFLRNSAATALSAATVAGLAPLTSFPVHAANTSGYKALVCVFLLGGMDNHDTLLPFDQASYNSFAGIRGDFLNAFGGGRDRSNLLELSPDNASSFGGRSFALPPEMEGLHSLFHSGEVAIVGNVGPLIESVTRSTVWNDSVRLPKRLFSHNDQMSTWQSSEPEGAQFGWGGLFADAVLASGANMTGNASIFTTVTSGGNELFLTGTEAAPYQISPWGAAEIDVVKWFGYNGSDEAIALLRDHMDGSSYSGSNLIGRDVAGMLSGAIEANERYKEAYEGRTSINTPFPGSYLAQQLRSVAETISLRDSLLLDRQVFFVGIGGFDTHDAQAADLPELHSEINDAFVAFNDAMKELGTHNDVTVFTASDFGRTLAINGNGTDHGWGAHHFVMGGAVSGRNIYGHVPEADYDHDYDSGGGRLIPTTSVEQFAEPMGRWFGLTNNELNIALPNLANFTSGSIDGLF